MQSLCSVQCLRKWRQWAAPATVGLSISSKSNNQIKEMPFKHGQRVSLERARPIYIDISMYIYRSLGYPVQSSSSTQKAHSGIPRWSIWTIISQYSVSGILLRTELPSSAACTSLCKFMFESSSTSYITLSIGERSMVGKYRSHFLPFFNYVKTGRPSLNMAEWHRDLLWSCRTLYSELNFYSTWQFDRSITNSHRGNHWLANPLIVLIFNSIPSVFGVDTDNHRGALSSPHLTSPTSHSQIPRLW